MKYSRPKHIDPACEADGIVFFAQRLEEMLASNSSDLHRMPLLNTHGLAAEYCEVAERVAKGILKEHYRTAVCDEFMFSFSNDIVLKENWGKANLERVTKTFGSCSQKNKDNIIAYIDATLDNGKYFNWAKETILKYVSYPKEKRKLKLHYAAFSRSLSCGDMIPTLYQLHLKGVFLWEVSSIGMLKLGNSRTL